MRRSLFLSLLAGAVVGTACAEVSDCVPCAGGGA